jgi:hypothetical protein
MLEPEERQILLDALRPPEGYDVSFAIGTTYTLDLLSLLTAPLGFTEYELAGQPGAELGHLDALRLLSVLRRHAEKVVVFCEAGRTAVPKRHTLLFGQLEQSVVEVRPPEGFSFHPKVWLIRFQDASDAEAVRYRLICLTRNLTFDRSWDTVLVLDGDLANRRTGFSVNRPVADFINALPGMAVRELSERASGYLETAADEVRRVAWEIPEPFEAITFWPLGIPGHQRRWPFTSIDRALVISPFLSEGFLHELSDEATSTLLVSRTDCLEKLGRPLLKKFAKVSQFSPEIVAESNSDEESAVAETMGSAGLHAKLFVLERGWDASLYTGSANATHAAFNGNVEFMVELAGKKSRVGIDALLAAERGQVRLCDLFVDFQPGATPLVEDPIEEERLARLDAARRALATREWTADAVELSDKRFRVTLRAGEGEPLPEGIVVLCRSALLPEHAAVEISTETLELTFEALSFEALTAFFAFDIRLTDGSAHEPCRFVVNAKLEGAPADRRERLTQCLLENAEQVVRFLLMLLTNHGGEIGTEGGESGDELRHAARGRGGREASTALLEPLLRALDRDPYQIDQVRELLDDLAKTEEGRAKLPAGIEAVWDAVWQVREELRAAEAEA